MKRILIVTPTPTHPQNAGNRRRVHTLGQILTEEGFELHWVHVRQERGFDERAMAAEWPNFTALPVITPKVKPIRWIYRLLQPWLPRSWALPLDVDEWYSVNLDAHLLQLHEQFRFDAVIVEYIWFSKALNVFGNDVLKIIDTHDIFAERHRLFLKRGLSPGWFFTTRRSEAKALNRADVTLAIQENDARHLRSLTSKPVVIVGHRTPVASNSRKPDSATILFVGSLNGPNLDGIRWFLRKSWPIIRSNEPGARLVVAGHCCQRLSPEPGVELRGEVSNLTALYESATVIINPTQFGTGLKIKTIEALGMGCPVVSTGIGAEGLSEEAYLRRDGVEEFAEGVLTLLRNPTRREELSAKAIAYVRDYNEVVRGTLLEILSPVRERREEYFADA
jgi:glycosyltransferase involved in cell wall biosynthesis